MTKKGQIMIGVIDEKVHIGMLHLQNDDIDAIALDDLLSCKDVHLPFMYPLKFKIDYSDL